MNVPNLCESSNWPYVLTFLPPDLDESARRTQALRRARGVADAASLLRLILCYALTDFSQKDVAAWGRAMGLATMSAVAFFYRVRDAERWLGDLLGSMLHEEVRPGPERPVRLRLVDATVINGPGAEGTDWRVHVQFDLQTGRFVGAEITDDHGGETLARHDLQPGDIVLGDRGYGHARGFASAVAAGADVVVRIVPDGLRLCGRRRQRLSLVGRARSVPQIGAVAFDVLVPVPPERGGRAEKGWKTSQAVGWVPGRVCAARTRSGEIVWVFTTLAADVASPAEVLDLYRLRWQVELAFKRWKSLLHLDQLPSPNRGPTAKSWILGRLLAAAIAEKLFEPDGSFPPWGYVLRDSRRRVRGGRG